LNLRAAGEGLPPVFADLEGITGCRMSWQAGLTFAPPPDRTDFLTAILDTYGRGAALPMELLGFVL